MKYDVGEIISFMAILFGTLIIGIAIGNYATDSSNRVRTLELCIKNNIPLNRCK